MKKNEAIKDMTLQEASDFWDEHDIGDFSDFAAIKDMVFALRKKKYVGIDIGLYAKIRKNARRMRVPEEVLINKWLRERV